MSVTKGTHRRAWPLMVGASSLVLLTSGALAAEDASLGEIVVTATKRATLIQNVPFSINAQTQADIERSNAQSIEDLSRNVAGLIIQNLGPGQSQVAIRGVAAGQVVRDQPGVKEQVGIYLDESVISLSLFTPDLDFFDLNRVEVLRGPQGTLFGSGSEGGTVRYITNQPRFDKIEGEVEAGVNTVDGGGEGGDIKGAINLPITDDLAARIVAYHTSYPGFINALRPDGSIDHDVNDGRRDGGRVALTWKPTDRITITPRVIYQEIETNGFNREEAFNLYANPFTVPPVTLAPREQFLRLREGFKDEFLLADGTVTADLGGVSLTSITSYTHRHILVSRDASALTGSVSVDLGYPAAAVDLPSNLRDRTSVNQYTEEFRVQSQDDGPFQWTLGAFYSHLNRHYSQRLPTPGYDAYTDATLGAGTVAATANGYGPDSPYNSDLPYVLSQVAGFAEGTYDVGPTVHLTAGIRYYSFDEFRTFTSGGLFSNDDRRSDKTSSDGVNPRFLASWNATENVTFNAEIAQGFRLGGVNDPLNVPLCSASDVRIFGGYQTYKDESLWDYEAGMKARFGPVRVNAALFYNDIENLQVTLDAGSCSSRIVFNVPKAHSNGVELELVTTPLPGLDFNISGSAIRSVFDSTVTDGTGAIIGGLKTGNRLPTVPNFQVTAGVTYTFPLDFLSDANAVLNASYQYVGSRYTQPSDQVGNPVTFVSGLPFNGATGTGATVLDLKLPDYSILNLSAGVKFASDLDVTFYVNNVTDELALLSFDKERNGRARLGYEVNQPRTFGITARKSF